MDVLAAFLADCCLRDEDEEAFAGEPWGAWKRWSGVGLRPNRESRAGLALNHSSARFAGNRAQPEPSEPKIDKVPDNIFREETLRKKGSEGSARRALGDLEDRPHGVMGGCELCR